MPRLPWVRPDTYFGQHDKLLRLKAERDGWRACIVYLQSIAYAGAHSTDGYIPRYVLGVIDGTERIARLLVEVRLWEYSEGGWLIRNYLDYQQSAEIGGIIQAGKTDRGRRLACKRWHKQPCGKCGGNVVDITATNGPNNA